MKRIFVKLKDLPLAVKIALGVVVLVLIAFELLLPGFLLVMLASLTATFVFLLVAFCFVFLWHYAFLEDWKKDSLKKMSALEQIDYIMNLTILDL